MADQYNYANELANYSNRINAAKSEASETASKVGQPARTVTSSLGAPLGIGLVKDGASSLIKSGKAVAEKTAKDAASRLQASARSALQDAKANVQARAENALANVRGQANDAVNAAKATTRDAISTARTAANDAVSTARTAANDAVSTARTTATNAVNTAQTTAADAANTAQTTVSTNVVSQAIGTDAADQAGSNILTSGTSAVTNALSGSASLSPFSVLPAGQIPTTGSFLATRGLGQASVQPAPAPVPVQPVVPDPDAIVPAVPKTGNSSVAPKPGADDEDLVDADKVATNVARDAKIAVDGEDTLEETGATISATTGAETGGIGAIVGGILAIGGVLASALAPHKKPQQEQNAAVPSLQLGI